MTPSRNKKHDIHSGTDTATLKSAVLPASINDQAVIMKSAKTILRQFWRTDTGKGESSSNSAGRAHRAVELNAAISHLWRADGTHSKTSFQANIVPIYIALLAELKALMTEAEAEECVCDLLAATEKACNYRWSVRLPLKRPGADYRRYEIIYTYALITAMAVDCLAEHDTSGNEVDKLATRIVNEEGMARLRADAIVWEDWLGYFDQVAIGGLYAVSICNARPTSAAYQRPSILERRENSVHDFCPEDVSQKLEMVADRNMRARKQPQAGSGREMLKAIREGLEEGALSFNQPGDAVQVDREGRTFLEHPMIFEWCIERLALNVDVKRLKNRFDRLKVYTRSAEGNQLFRGRLRKRDRRSRGYVLEDSSLLWSEAPPRGRFVIENVTAKY